MRTDWSTKGWKKGQVTILQAFGLEKAKFTFPPFNPQLPDQVSKSRQQSKGSPGAHGGGSESANEALAQQMVTKAFGASQWPAFKNIVGAEDSTWSVTATNPSSGAYGIPQALPGSKMAASGANWQTSAATQIAWMIGYIRSTYGTPAAAWQFHLANGWY